MDTTHHEKGIVMAKINLYQISDNDKADIYRQASVQSGIPAYAVEKDWWVVQTLDMIFEMPIAEQLVFKGGTSLSKGWGLIERFSEDVDLAIDRGFFGFGGTLERREIDKLRRAAGAYIDKEFLDGLQQKVEKRGFTNVRLEIEPGLRSDRDRTILLHYPNVIESPGYLQPRVKIEFSCRSLMEPSSLQSFGSVVDDVFPEAEFTKSPITIATVNPERTLLEKIFLLHEEFQKPLEKIRRGDRLSRHLYDVAKLSATEFADTALLEPELYRTIVSHRQQFNAIPGVDYSCHAPSQIRIIPVEDVLAEWQMDYNTMIEEMIYEEKPPSFQEILETLKQLQKRINLLRW
jgi:predicted nucleotidyltransferase component of viral defense system